MDQHGREAEREVRFKALHNYQINQALLNEARPEAIVLHCLPAHRGEEITEEVLEGPQSVVFDQAENRLHVPKGYYGAADERRSTLNQVLNV